MSWNRYLRYTKWYRLFPGLWTEDSGGDIPQDQILYQQMVGRAMRRVPGAMYLERATNVYAPGATSILRTRPGFEKIHATAVSSTGIFTGFVHLGEIADEFLASMSIAGDKHSIYRYNANPPGELSGGSNPTIGADNLSRPVIFTDGTTPGAIFTFRLRDAHQFVSGTPTRSTLTVAGVGLSSLKAAIAEVFAQRVLYGDVNVDGTVYDDRVYHTDIRDGNLISDSTTQFLSFETTLKDRVRALRKLSDICLVGKLNNIFTMVPTENAGEPFMVQEEPAGRGRGTVSHNAVEEADHKLFWLGQSNIHSMDQQFQFRDWADAIQPTIRGLSDSRREVAISGVDVDRSLILFNVSDSGQSTHDVTIALNYKTGALYLWDLRRNAFGYREVSGQIRLVGGGYTGNSYYEMTGTRGSLDDATAVIGSDVISAKLWVNAYGTKQKIPFILLAMDPIASEQLTVTYALDDEDILTSPRTSTGSPYTMSGNKHKIVLVPIKAVAERIQVRIYNNATDAVYLVKGIGVPALPLQHAFT